MLLTWKKGTLGADNFWMGLAKNVQKEKTTYNNKILLGLELREMQPVSL